jgi:hypothetical protein
MARCLLRALLTTRENLAFLYDDSIAFFVTGDYILRET